MSDYIDARMKLISVFHEAEAVAVSTGKVGWRDGEMSDAVENVERAVLSIIEDHWPDYGADQSDSCWVTCVCGWDSSAKGSPDWQQHLLDAIDEFRFAGQER